MATIQSFPALLDAYRAALYEVVVNTQVLTIHVGRPLPAAIDARLAANAVNDAAFLTAANPYSEPCDEVQNARQHAALLKALAALGVPWLAAQGRDPRDRWPAESSVLALGLGREAAVMLAEQFEQYAYVEVVREAPARLVFTAHWHAPGAVC